MALKPVSFLLSFLLILGFCCGCKPASRSIASPSSLAKVAALPQPTAATWSTRATIDWPQLVLTNRAEFKGHTPLQGASAFLVSTPDGRTLAATARHLIGPNGGVEPEIALGQFDTVLSNWKMFPRTRDDSFVEIQGLGTKALDERGLDWLILDLKSPPSELPCTPLKMRPKPVEIGETIYLVGCPYIEEDCSQNVYVGTVTERKFGHMFRYDVKPPVDIRGFSGAPLVDSSGLAVGVMTVWFEPKMSGDLYLEAGGQDIALVLAALQIPSK